MALDHGACLIEINPLATPLSLHADQCFRGTASDVLCSIVSQLKSWKHNRQRQPNRNGE
jgi:NAD-dependent SIR2 family protein deacetylase